MTTEFTPLTECEELAASATLVALAVITGCGILALIFLLV